MFKRKDPAALQSQLAALKGGAGFSSEDKNEWKLKTDAAGNGSAVIRFLPSKNEENPSPFVKLVNHGFKKGGKWYIENCTSTHGDYENCPVCQHLSKNDSFNTNEAEYKLLKRKTSYWANVLVLKDPSSPENEGKVMKFRFGQKIMDKINAEVEVDTSIGEVPVDVTCVYEGKNFTMKVKKVAGFQNYDECKFGAQSEVAKIDDPATQKFLEENMADLTKIIAKDQFKTLETNQAKFNQVMGTAALGGAASRAAAVADSVGDSLDSFDKDMQDFDAGTSTQTPVDGGTDELDDLLKTL